MDLQAIGTFSIVVLFLTIMPGPNTVLILKTVTQNGRRQGIINLAGIVSGFYIHGLFSILGLSALILKTSQIFFTVKLLGSLYLLYLGITSLWQAFFSKNSTQIIKHEYRTKIVHDHRKFFTEGFITSLLNPKASVFYLAIFPQFVNFHGNPVMESTILVVIHSLIVLIWFSFLIAALGKITNLLSSAGFKQIVQIATGSLLLWFGYRLFTYQQEN